MYLDPGATSQTAARARGDGRLLRDHRASIHRGVYPSPLEATDAYEARAREGRRLHRLDAGETIFTRNATEAINLVAYAWGRATSAPGTSW